MSRFARILLASSALVALALPAGAAALPANSTFLVSRPSSGSLVAPTDNASYGPLAVSADGRYVAFYSSADGFAPGANPGLTNLFVRDTVANTTVLASRSDGPNGVAADADITYLANPTIGIVVEPGSQVADAPHDQPHVLVVFSTEATNLVDHADHAIPQTGGLEEVWMRDVTAGTTYLVSRADNGSPANGRSRRPSIAASPVGPLVAFASDSSNLGDFGPTVPTTGVYLREVKAGITETVSCASKSCSGGATSQGPSREPSLQFIEGSNFTKTPLCSPGQLCALVAFATDDPTIAAKAGPNHSQVVVARALLSPGATKLAQFDLWTTASVTAANAQVEGNASSWEPAMSPVGTYVSFLSDATGLQPSSFPAPPPGVTEAYKHYFGAETFVDSVGLDSFGFAGPPADADVIHVSTGGYFPYRVGFDTTADNITAPASFPPLVRAYSYVNEIVRPTLDRSAGVNGVLGDGWSSNTTISGDGQSAVFLSRSTNLDAGGGTEFARVYKRNLDPKSPTYEKLELVSRPSGTGAFSPGDKTSVVGPDSTSADGRFVAFESKADDLSNADDDRFTNVFVRDTVNGTTTLVSRASGANGAAADANSKLNGISDDGQKVLFTSPATDFGTAGKPGPHGYVRDLATQTTTVVNRGTGATSLVTPGPGLSISGNGNRVAFSTSGILDPEASGGPHLYVRDLNTLTTTFADRADGEFGTPAESGPLEAALDKTGNRVAWTTTSVLTPGAGSPNFVKIYVRDLTAHTTVLASRADGADGAGADAHSTSPAIDAAGDTVAFESGATNLGASGPQRSIWVRQLATGHTELVSRAPGVNGLPANRLSYGPVSIDAAGDRVAFVSAATNLLAGEMTQELPNALVYVRDLKTKTTETASRVDGLGGAVAEPSGVGSVSISGNGDCVAFSGTGANFTDALASADFSSVRERVLRGSCGPASPVAAEPSPPASDTPAVTNLRMQPGRFYVGADGGAQMSFVLSEASRVNVKFLRPAKHGPDRVVGRLSVQGHAGTNKVEFSGRVKGRALAPGHYRWTAKTQRGRASSGRFQVVAPPSRRAQRRHR